MFSFLIFRSMKYAKHSFNGPFLLYSQQRLVFIHWFLQHVLKNGDVLALWDMLDIGRGVKHIFWPPGGPVLVEKAVGVNKGRCHETRRAKTKKGSSLQRAEVNDGLSQWGRCKFSKCLIRAQHQTLDTLNQVEEMLTFFTDGRQWAVRNIGSERQGRLSLSLTRNENRSSNVLLLPEWGSSGRLDTSFNNCQTQALLSSYFELNHSPCEGC